MKIASRNPFLFLSLLWVVLAIHCGNKPETKEMVVRRFPDGSPREVWIFTDNDRADTHTEVIYYDNGQKKRQRVIANGLPDGPWLEWHRNGQIKYKKNYRAGNLDGEQAGWFMTGEPLYQAAYANGQQISRTTWDIHGNVVSHDE